MSNGAPCDFLLVIPAFEEHRRLPSFLRELAGALAATSFRTQIQIVDDGSSAASLRELRRAVDGIPDAPSVQILPVIAAPRGGKGAAIRSGWNNAVPSKWRAFVDADGAIPPTELVRVFESKTRQASPTCSVAVRGGTARRSLSRGSSGRAFTGFINALFGSSFCDPQCGFKIISSEAWKNIGARSRENHFCFDLELLLLLRGETIAVEEIPIDWIEQSGGHFRLVPDGIATLLAAIGLRFRLQRGA